MSKKSTGLESAWENFYIYVVDAVAAGPAIDFHPRPFILSAILLCLARGDTVGLRQLIHVGLPLVEVPEEYSWIGENARRVLDHWQKIEDNFGEGVMLDGLALISSTSRYEYDKNRLDAAISYQEQVGRDLYLRDLRFEF